MPRAIAACRCPHCQGDQEHPDRLLHQQLNLLMSRLDEAQRRWVAAMESTRLGYGGDTRVSQITGLDEKTIRRGRDELAASLTTCPVGRVRRVGGGRPATEKKTQA
jgi:hypothetical protein